MQDRGVGKPGWAKYAVLVSLFAPCLMASFPAIAAEPASHAASHAIAMHGKPKYPANFRHYDYVNPSAPKGGTLRQAALQTFDTLNPFILKGVPGALTALPYDTLLSFASDEPFTGYGLLAETVSLAPDRGSVTFKLRKQARFNDGTPVTAKDVVFTFNILMKKGHPRYRIYYGGVSKVEALDRLRVKFTFRNNRNRELPLILGQIAILPRHYWQSRDFSKTTLTPPLGSGPYRIINVDPGRSITYERVKNYWGKDLAVKTGRHNFDRIHFDYYRDSTVALEALKGGNYDFREENPSKFWAASYDSPAVRQGLLKKLFLNHNLSTGMQAFVFNTRRDIFKDVRVRKALANAFDFEWTNRVLFFGAYTRTNSYFSNSELAATKLPDAQELALLKPFRGTIPDSIFTKVYAPPDTGSTHGGLRRNLLSAIALLKKAGWIIRDGKLVNGTSGKPMTFEILLINPSFERIVLPFVGNLKRLGIEANIRTVDTSQYINRIKKFDFDMIINVWGQSLSPGNEQRDYWASKNADVTGGFNYAGIRDKAADAIIEKIILAPDRKALVAASRALDRILLAGHYVIPQWHIRGDRLAFWDKFGRPKITPKMGYQLDSWWLDRDKEAALKARKTAVLEEAKIEKSPKDADKPKPWPWFIGGIFAIAFVWWLRSRKRRKKQP